MKHLLLGREIPTIAVVADIVVRASRDPQRVADATGVEADAMFETVGV